MNCEFNYCVYHKEGKCTVDEIQINQLGMCDACMIVTLDEEFLEEVKQKQLEDISRRDYDINNE